MSANALAKALSVPVPRINDVVCERGISADTAIRLARYFGGDARSWLNLQAADDLRVAEISSAKRIARKVSPAAACSAAHARCELVTFDGLDHQLDYSTARSQLLRKSDDFLKQSLAVSR